MVAHLLQAKESHLKEDRRHQSDGHYEMYPLETSILLREKTEPRIQGMRQQFKGRMFGKIPS